MKKLSGLEILELITILILFGVIVTITNNGIIKECNVSQDAASYLSNNDKKYIAEYIDNEITNCNLNDVVASLTNASDSNNMFLKMYPVGSIYTSINSTNPGTIFGGTWIEFGSGRTLVGVDTNDNDFKPVEKTGGEKEHLLTETELPVVDSGVIAWHGQEHGTHVYNIGTKWYGTQVSGQYQTTGATSGAYSYSNIGFRFGGGAAHNNLQPYITVYMWKRTA